jgi:transcriptional regulator with XRE-family HTH domain
VVRNQVLTGCLQTSVKVGNLTLDKAVPVGVHCTTDAQPYRGEALIDKDASARLLREVQRLYLERTGRPTFSVLALSEWSGVNRQPLRNYLQNGVFPDPDVLSNLATALGVPVAQLWVKWLDLGMSDPLVRIADALERAYPPTAEELEGRRRADAAAQALQAPEAAGSRAKRSAPPSTTGSGR